MITRAPLAVPQAFVAPARTTCERNCMTRKTSNTTTRSVARSMSTASALVFMMCGSSVPLAGCAGGHASDVHRADAQQLSPLHSEHHPMDQTRREMAKAICTGNGAERDKARDRLTDELAELYVELKEYEKATEFGLGKSPLAALMSQWNPIWFTAEEVQKILGPPQQSKEDRMIYIESRSISAVKYELIMSRDTVIGVTVELGG